MAFSRCNIDSRMDTLQFYGIPAGLAKLLQIFIQIFNDKSDLMGRSLFFYDFRLFIGSFL